MPRRRGRPNLFEKQNFRFDNYENNVVQRPTFKLLDIAGTHHNEYEDDSAIEVRASGLQIEVISLPDDCHRFAENGNTLTMEYTGTLANGEKFDSSYDAPEPFKFKLGDGQVKINKYCYFKNGCFFGDLFES
jgi:FKBP-type peptidyl-prolyl cis-trans isomerase